MGLLERHTAPLIPLPLGGECSLRWAGVMQLTTMDDQLDWIDPLEERDEAV